MQGSSSQLHNTEILLLKPPKSRQNTEDLTSVLSIATQSVFQYFLIVLLRFFCANLYCKEPNRCPKFLTQNVVPTYKTKADAQNIHNS